MTGSLQIKSDKYYAVLNFKDENGKRVQKWVPLNLPVRGNKRKAEVMLTELINEYQGMECVEPVNRLLSQHIALWIERDRPHIAVTTYNQYVNMLKLHIAPYFDERGITVGSVTPGDLEDYYRDKVASGLSPNTVIKHHAIIRSSLQWAMKHQYIRYNPADLADKPSRVKYQANEPYSVEEIVQLLTLTQNEPIAVPIFLASFYGLRRSELLGLRWSAIDFQNGWIHIETTVVKEKIGDRVVSTVREGTTKNRIQPPEPAPVPVYLPLFLLAAAAAADSAAALRCLLQPGVMRLSIEPSIDALFSHVASNRMRRQGTPPGSFTTIWLRKQE